MTARGEVVTASAEANPDLFWGLRGGGGNFGVVTAFEYRLHPLRQVFGGIVAHSLADGAEALRFYREFTATAPDELAVMGLLVHAPDGSGAPSPRSRSAMRAIRPLPRSISNPSWGSAHP